MGEGLYRWTAGVGGTGEIVWGQSERHGGGF